MNNTTSIYQKSLKDENNKNDCKRASIILGKNVIQQSDILDNQKIFTKQIGGFYWFMIHFVRLLQLDIIHNK